MALHATTVGLVKEAISEYLYAAEWCIRYVKSSSWGPNQAGGCLGYPGAVLLFCIADTIGSYHRGNASFTFRVDGKDCSIHSNGEQHFYILNGDYYGLSLTGSQIKDLYTKYRNLLIHNSALAPGAGLAMVPERAEPLVEVPQVGLCVNVGPFLALSKKAVQLFLDRADQLVPASHQQTLIEKKASI
jgi:hypothetical protein